MSARRAIPSLLLALAAVFWTSGCSWVKSWGDEDPRDPAPLVEFEPTLEVRKIWSVDIGDGMGKQGLSMAPVFSEGVIFAADHEGELLAIDADSGQTLWQLDTGLPFSGGPGVGDDLVVMGTIDGNIIAFDRNNGSQVWNARVSSEVLAAPGVGDGMVVVRSIDGRVFGLDGTTGSRLWIYDHSVPLLTMRGNASLLLRAGAVFVGYDDGTVVTLRLQDGSVLWQQGVVNPEGRTELERLSDIGQQMVIVASDLIVSSYKNRVASLAADSGRLLWFKDIASHTGVQVDRVNLGISDARGDVWLLDRRNGSTLWKIDQLTNRGLTRPAFYGQYMVVGDKEGYLHWIDTDSGNFVARERQGKKGFASAPFSVGTTLYVLNNSGSLVAYRAGAAL